MPSVPRELPPTPNLTRCLCEAMLRAPFLTPKPEKGTGSHGNPPPPNAPEGTPATPPQRRRALRARARPGRGHPPTSIHHDVYHPARCPLSTQEHTFSRTEKPQHSRSMEPAGANLCHFRWDSLTDSSYRFGAGE